VLICYRTQSEPRYLLEDLNPSIKVLEPAWDSEAAGLQMLHSAYNVKLKRGIDIPFKPFPSLIGTGLAKYKQEDSFPFPGGYLNYLVIEKLPGECISENDFWD
jgi:hypothetical protein